MDNIESFEARAASHRPVFFQLYNLFENLDRIYKLAPVYDNASIKEIEEMFKALPDAYKLKKTVKNNQDRYDYLIFQIAAVLKLFVEFGPGKGEDAWAYLVEANRKGMEGAKNE
jgi:hypothetical protein